MQCIKNKKSPDLTPTLSLSWAYRIKPLRDSTALSHYHQTIWIHEAANKTAFSLISFITSVLPILKKSWHTELKFLNDRAHALLLSVEAPQPPPSDE